MFTRLAKGFRGAATATAFAVAAGFAAQTATAAELIFNNYAPPPSPVTKVLFEQFAADIEAATNGEVTVTIPATSMAPVNGNWELVTNGIVDVVNQAAYVMPQQFKLQRLAELPFNTLSAEAASVALNRTYDKYFAESGEYDGVKVLAFTVFAGRQIMNNVRPIETIEDYAGLKIWTTPGPLAAAADALGATAVPAPFPKLFEFASKGTVDGMMYTPSTARSSQTGDYVQYYTHIPGGLGSISFAMVMNQDSWDRLSPEHQEAIQTLADDLPSKYGKVQDGDEESALGMIGVETLDASPELVAAIEERLAGFEAGWIETAKGAGIENPQEVLDYYREQMELAADAATN
ncbi:MAG: TRAP transporter substrate-binding protein DctP [Maritimibacter sp.]|uniref:TRAP transporter substrate-binding protein DctP n=1 Tax=Maritimibacter sp. TaxID=2003363 RepID=UPI001DDC5929|nr:TRAP transporter substrate-binding protein DctP [Maritimibacter sp.]MBL6426771.1 TRAP transporter substrate-binding protein DctP [Maritimibacter sp.]